ncbi:MAG TPA: hypothetical protein VGF28_22580 [Thermoanaerobaculia bacterium]
MMTLKATLKDKRYDGALKSGNTGSRRRQTVVVAVVALCLCICSILQLSIATEMMRHARRLFEASNAAPPHAVQLLFPLWSRVARLPWEPALILLYGTVAAWALRSDRERAVLRLIVLWLLISTIFFAGLWLAVLPYRSCCV